MISTSSNKKRQQHDNQLTVMLFVLSPHTAQIHQHTFISDKRKTKLAFSFHVRSNESADQDRIEIESKSESERDGILCAIYRAFRLTDLFLYIYSHMALPA